MSDIHGNRPAFEAVLQDISATDCQEVWSLGDLVGYGAEPDACVELARQRCAISLAGNHDLGVTGVLPLEEFSAGARLAAEWTRATISSETLAYLQALQPLNEHEAVGLYHASPRDPIWEYVLSPLQADLCLDAQPGRISFVGHSHVALSFSRPDGGSATGEVRNAGTELDLSEGEWLLNPGSVGQPRDGNARAAWLEVDLETWKVQYHRIQYDIDEAAAAIRAARLPESLAERLYDGR